VSASDLERIAVVRVAIGEQRLDCRADSYQKTNRPPRREADVGADALCRRIDAIDGRAKCMIDAMGFLFHRRADDFEIVEDEEPVAVDVVEPGMLVPLVVSRTYRCASSLPRETASRVRS